MKLYEDVYTICLSPYLTMHCYYAKLRGVKVSCPKSCVIRIYLQNLKVSSTEWWLGIECLYEVKCWSVNNFQVQKLRPAEMRMLMCHILREI